MSWFSLVLLLIFTCNNLSEGGLAHNHKQSAVVVVVGTVYCDTCFQSDFSYSSHFISGATVAVECKDGNSSSSFQQEVKTNKEGQFKVELPLKVSKHVKEIEGCKVKLVKSSEPYCSVASTANSSSSIRLKSRKHGVHVFSAGFFTFKPLKQPSLCNRKQAKKSKLAPPQNEVRLEDSAVHPDQFLPPNPLQPPLLPPNPLTPPPLIPNPLQPPPAPLIPNPFQPPPAPLIPNPFQPPPAPPSPLIPNPFQPPPAPPSPLIPNPFQPPPAPRSPFFPLPPIPGLIPSPSPPPPPPPAFPFPLPPLPFPPIFPGIPPAATSTNASTP